MSIRRVSNNTEEKNLPYGTKNATISNGYIYVEKHFMDPGSFDHCGKVQIQ